MRIALFPGQGSQYVGMGKALNDTFLSAKEVFQEVDEVLGQSLSRLMFNGDEADLRNTRNAQPALMTVSMATVRVLQAEGKINFEKAFPLLAGHSLGEYTAYCATGTFSLGTAAKLLRKRGASMLEAVAPGEGGMDALIGADPQAAEKLCQAVSKPDSFCHVANDNAPGQIVISGHLSALAQAREQAPQFGIKRAIPLPVSGPFHSPLMAPAATVMAEALEKTTLVERSLQRVISNVLGHPVDHADEVRETLVAQMTGRVRWVDSMRYAQSQGVTHAVELGAGQVLCGLMKRICPDVVTLSLENPDDIDTFVKHFS
jgi:[acyl-carrier-protein] S-malonyltransferase